MVKKLAFELGKRDYESLCGFVSTLTFEQAFNALNGFNLDVCICTQNDKYLDHCMFFDCNYKSISTTIFKVLKIFGSLKYSSYLCIVIKNNK